MIVGGLVLIVGCSALLTAGSEDIQEEGTGGSDAAKVKVERSQLIYEPEQTGGKFHAGFVLVRNSSDEPIQVDGQVSVKEGGKLVKSYEPSTVVLPRSRGLLVEDALDLSKPVRRGKLEAELVSAPVGAAGPPPRVKISKLRYGKDEIAGCKISGTVTHNRKEPMEVRVNAIGYRGRRIVTGGFTFIERAFPGSPATFEIDIPSDALCPARVDRMEAFWDPGPDGLSG